MGLVLAVAALYLIINFVLLRVNGVSSLGSQECPLGSAHCAPDRHICPALLGISGLILIIGCCHAGLMVAPRIAFGLARDGFIPRFAAQVNRPGTPQISLAIITLASAALAVTGSFEAAFRVVATTGVALSLLLDLVFFALRHRDPKFDRPYRGACTPGFRHLRCCSISLSWFQSCGSTRLAG